MQEEKTELNKGKLEEIKKFMKENQPRQNLSKNSVNHI